jgi:hypothetical protein
MGNRDVYIFLVGKSEEKMKLGKLRFRWKVNTRMDPQEKICAHGLDTTGAG